MYHIILNPASQSGKGKTYWTEEAEPYLKEKQIPHKVYFSQKEGDLAAIAKSILDNEPVKPVHMIVLGGDGTINELLQGIEHPSDVILGYVPTGSSNDLARALHLPSNRIREALDIIFYSGHPSNVDLGKIILDHSLERIFITSCGMGFDAAVCEKANRSGMKNLLNRFHLGKLVYLAVALKEIISAPRYSGTIKLNFSDYAEKPDSQTLPLKRLFFVAGMNHAYEGGGFMFGPGAKDDDGRLNVCLVEKIAKGMVFLALPFAVSGKHFMFRGVTEYHPVSYEVTAEKPLWVHTDGEVLGQASHIQVTVQKQAIFLMKP